MCQCVPELSYCFLNTTALSQTAEWPFQPCCDISGGYDVATLRIPTASKYESHVGHMPQDQFWMTHPCHPDWK